MSLERPLDCRFGVGDTVVNCSAMNCSAAQDIELFSAPDAKNELMVFGVGVHFFVCPARNCSASAP